MTVPGDPARQRRSKRQDLLDGAVQVFAEDGFSRATVDRIAEVASVSTRTVYNQYNGKDDLFRAAIVDSATAVATAQIALVDRVLGSIHDADQLRPGLAEFARHWSTPDPAAASHFALVRQVVADREHIPAEAIQAWQQAGPRPVHARICEHLRRLVQVGLLDVADAAAATDHLIALTTAGVDRRSFGATGPSTRQVRKSALAGVDVFLAAYAVRPAHDRVGR